MRVIYLPPSYHCNTPSFSYGGCFGCDVSSTVRWHPNAQSRSLNMVIVPISKSQLANIAPKTVNPDQWRAYWGGNQIERLQRVMESVLVAYGGAWAAWFLSFMMGNFVSTFLGCGLIFNWMFTPYLTSSKSNNSLWYKNGRMMHHALFRGSIVSLKRIRRRSGKSVGAVTQVYLDLLVVDELNRELQVITAWKDEYRQLRRGMSIETMIASTSRVFANVVTMTDAYVPACNIWVGDYPYLEKKEFLKLRRSLWTIDEEEREEGKRQRTNEILPFVLDIEEVQDVPNQRFGDVYLE